MILVFWMLSFKPAKARWVNSFGLFIGVYTLLLLKLSHYDVK